MAVLKGIVWYFMAILGLCVLLGSSAIIAGIGLVLGAVILGAIIVAFLAYCIKDFFRSRKRRDS